MKQKNSTMSNYPYKARNYYTGDWVYGYYVHLDSGKITSDRIYLRFAETDCSDFYPDWYEVQPGSICRCTDLVDCIGSSIYEHDIISFLDEFGKECRASVKYCNGCFVIFHS